MTDPGLEDIKRELLRAAYVAFFVERAPLDTHELRIRHQWNGELFRRALDEGMGISWYDSGHHKIQSSGVGIAEDLHLPSSELVEENTRVREALLTCLGEVYEREGGLERDSWAKDSG